MTKITVFATLIFMSCANDVKHWFRDLFNYPTFWPADASYDEYWSHRGTNKLNSFQKFRADFLLNMLKDGDSVLDIGCGDGRILAFLKDRKPSLKLSGIDSSPFALEIAKSRGLDVRRCDLRDLNSLGDVKADYITVLEVLEHIPASETLLSWAVTHARKGVIFSVPNTGFIMHRLRLLFGRFPLQWRAHPSEHVRFWTLRDMRWWLNSLGYKYELYAYEGASLLNRPWPSLFAAGMIVRINNG